MIDAVAEDWHWSEMRHPCPVETLHGTKLEPAMANDGQEVILETVEGWPVRVWHGNRLDGYKPRALNYVGGIKERLDPYQQDRDERAAAVNRAAKAGYWGTYSCSDYLPQSRARTWTLEVSAVLERIQQEHDLLLHDGVYEGERYWHPCTERTELLGDSRYWPAWRSHVVGRYGIPSAVVDKALALALAAV